MTYKSDRKYSQNVLSLTPSSGMICAINIQLEAPPNILSFEEANDLLSIIAPEIKAYLDRKCQALDKELTQKREGDK